MRLSYAERRKVAHEIAGHVLGLHIAGGVVLLLIGAVALDQLAQAGNLAWRRIRG